MPPSTLMLSPGGSTGIFRRATPSTPMSQEMCLSPRALAHSAASRKTKKKTQQRDVFSQKRGSVATHLRGMRPTLTTKKDTLTIMRNSNIMLFLLNYHYNYTMYFLLLCTYTDTYIIRNALLIFAILFKVMHSIYFYFTPFFLFHLGNILCRTVKRTSARE